VTSPDEKDVSEKERNWLPAKDFTEPGCKVCVRVHRKAGKGKPTFSLQICRVTFNGKMSPHFAIYSDTVAGQVSLRESVAEDIHRFVTQAEEWALGEIQVYEESVLQKAPQIRHNAEKRG
jgi:hypothetical protein